MAEIRFDLVGDSSSLESAASDAETAIGGVDDGLKDAGKTGKNVLGKEIPGSAKIAKKALGAAALAAGAMTAALIGTAKAAIDLSAQANIIAKDAKKIGTSAEELQILQGSFDLLSKGGINAARAIQDLQRGLAEAADGAGPAKDALGKLGIEASDFAGLGIADQIQLIADNFGNLDNEADRAQVPLDLLGRAGRELGPAFREGGGAIAEAMVKIEAAGVISNKTAAQSEVLQDNILLLGNTFDSVKRDVLEPLIPVMAGVAEAVRAMLSDFRDTGEAEEFGQTIRRIFVEIALPAIASFAQFAETSLLGVQSTFAGFKVVAAGLSLAWAKVTGTTEEAEAAAIKYEESLETSARAAFEFSQAQGSVNNRWTDMIDRANSAAAAARDVGVALGVSGSGRGAGAGAGAGAGGDGDGGGGVTFGAIDPAEDLRIVVDQNYLDFTKDAHDQLDETREASHDAEMARSADLLKEREANLGDWLSMTAAVTSSIGGLITDVTAISVASTREGSDEHKKALRDQWAASTAVAILEAGINIPLSISQAAAAPWPAAIGFMVAAGIASGAALGGVIAKAAIGPSFHTGGIARGSTGQQALGSDEFAAVLRAGEEIRSPQGARTARESRLRDDNAGISDSRPMVNVFKIRNQTTDVQMSENLRTRRGPLWESIRQDQPRVGRHLVFE